uniref:F-box domain-containing protein n=1 Tax=Panagrolaimus sp. ES5 TaxID=591445 RepID=A0AC34FQU1_9BILA
MVFDLADGNPYWDQQIAGHIIPLILYKLAGECLVPKEYWDYCRSLIRYQGERAKEWRQDLKAFSKAHFHFEKDFTGNLEQFHLLLLDYQYRIDESGYSCSKHALSYPHSHLKHCFRIYERHSIHQPSDKLIKKYEEMQKMYLQIKAAEKDSEKWFQLLIEIDNVNFVCDNVECRLGKNLLDNNLWKLYIDFLREKNPKQMLYIYFKYCRFFMDDSEMIEKYKEEMAKYGPLSSKHEFTWHNWFDFEKTDKSTDAVEKEESKNLNVDKKEAKTFDKNLCKNFFANNTVQNFPFQYSLISYILNNASHRVLRKLFQTCKYFFTQKQILICYRFEAWNVNCFRFESLGSEISEKVFKLMKFHITGYIGVEIEVENEDSDDEIEDSDDESKDSDDEIEDSDDESEDDDDKNDDSNVKSEGRSFMSSFIPRIYQCDAKFIRFWNQNLSFNELKFLIGSGNVVEMKLKNCEIKDSDANYIDLEKIMEFLPNIEKLRLSDVKVNPNTANALTNQKNFGKISKFAIREFNGEPFDVDEFLKFFIVNFLFLRSCHLLKNILGKQRRKA